MVGSARVCARCVPADIQVGKNVTLYTEPGADGSETIVRRVTTTSVTPGGARRAASQSSVPEGLVIGKTITISEP